VGEWEFKDSDLKKYPHFDAFISIQELAALATNPKRVEKHPFYPFIRYIQRWNRFAKKGKTGKPKTRPIRYAARSDAAIFSYYRHILSEKYESELKRLGLEKSILAYRRIPVESGAGGKCNIHFARDAFLKIQELGNCCAIVLDISSYFESLDHVRLRTLWCRMMGVNRLSNDHFKVFERITKYAVVDKQQVYERLGHFGKKRVSKAGKPINGYLTPFKKMPKQLCHGKEFQEKISPIIKRNHKPYGIPQGAPISDLLANNYLLDFDCLVDSWVRAVGGAYYRYSDDILVIVPGNESVGLEFLERIRNCIRKFGKKLVIKEEKSSVFVFDQSGEKQKFKLVNQTRKRNGLEYLGFRYDGRNVYLRDNTLSNLRRKVVRAARRDANIIARRYPDKDAVQLRSSFNYERLIKQFGRVEDFDEKQKDYRNWTFWTYATRAASILGSQGRRIPHQLRKHRKLIIERANHELERAVIRRGSTKSA
jgi:hypothetical protein